MSHRGYQYKMPGQKQIERTGLFASSMRSVGVAITQHPSFVGGGTVFIIVFLFIAANALWYQKGMHPAPILDMRGSQKLVASSTRPIILPSHNIQTNQRVAEIKTFEVTRGDDIQTATIQQAETEDAFSVPTPLARRAFSEKLRSAENKILIIDIQTLLAQNNLYAGDVDGLMGPKTKMAIKSYQETQNLNVDGEPSQVLLDHMRAQNQKREPELASISQNVDQEDLVRQIQIGLSQSAYPHIEVDGLIGQQTQDAILQFEKHYRLPLTGMPNDRVLDKLRQIGAFN